MRAFQVAPRVCSAALSIGRGAGEAAVALDLGTGEVHAGILPGGKAGIVRALRTDGEVAAVGEEVNDASALTQAHVGIAMSTGTATAILRNSLPGRRSLCMSAVLSVGRPAAASQPGWGYCQRGDVDDP